MGGTPGSGGTSPRGLVRIGMDHSWRYSGEHGGPVLDVDTCVCCFRVSCCILSCVIKLVHDPVELASNPARAHGYEGIPRGQPGQQSCWCEALFLEEGC